MGFTLETGQPAPLFELPGVDGKKYTLENFSENRVLIVAFTCNHCPYVVGSEERMMKLVKDYKTSNVGFVAINSNQEDDYPGDNFDAMIERSQERKFNFPYLRDLTQETAKAYGAIKTPHFFVFDGQRVLQYNGRMDDSPNDPGQAQTKELRDALDALLAGKSISEAVTEPIGCSVKWKGRDSHWIPTDICDFDPDKAPLT